MEWVELSQDNKPEEYERVLCYTSEQIKIFTFAQGKFFNDEDFYDTWFLVKNPSHWMSLPKPPE